MTCPHTRSIAGRRIACVRNRSRTALLVPRTAPGASASWFSTHDNGWGATIFRVNLSRLWPALLSGRVQVKPNEAARRYILFNEL
jgi:hypothetical protein